MQNDPVVIVGAARTPMGGLQGDLKSLAAPALGAVAIKAALERAGIGASEIDEVIMGNVLQAGEGQAPARQAALRGGLSPRAGALPETCGRSSRGLTSPRCRFGGRPSRLTTAATGRSRCRT